CTYEVGANTTVADIGRWSIWRRGLKRNAHGGRAGTGSRPLFSPARTANESAMTKSLRGQLLISGGALFDPHFRHTVVLIGAHNEEGALGVVLNRPTARTVEEAYPALVNAVGVEGPLFEGGPVNPELPVLLAE